MDPIFSGWGLVAWSSQSLKEGNKSYTLQAIAAAATAIGTITVTLGFEKWLHFLVAFLVLCSVPESYTSLNGLCY